MEPKQSWKINNTKNDWQTGGVQMIQKISAEDREVWYTKTQKRSKSGPVSSVITIIMVDSFHIFKDRLDKQTRQCSYKCCL